MISLASPTEWVPRPSRSLRRAGHGNACACRLIPSLRNKSYSTGIIDARPCKKRKDGAPSVEMLHIEMVKVGHPPLFDYLYVLVHLPPVSCGQNGRSGQSGLSVLARPSIITRSALPQVEEHRGGNDQREHHGNQHSPYYRDG